MMKMIKMLLIGFVLSLMLCGAVSAIGTSIYGVDIPVDDATLSSLTYVDLFDVEINTSSSETMFLVSSLNLEKISGGGINVVSAQIIVDAVVVYEGAIRSMQDDGDVGSTSIPSTGFTVTSGEHNLIVKVKRSGDGVVLISNMNFNIMKKNTNDGSEVAVTNIIDEYDYSSTTYIDTYNFTHTKTYSGKTYIIMDSRLNASAATTSSFYIKNDDNNTESMTVSRYMQNDVDVGSSLISWKDIYEEPGTYDYSIYSKTSDTDTVTQSINMYIVDLVSNLNNTVYADYYSNPLFNSLVPVVVDDTKTLISNMTHTQVNGSSLFLSMSTVFNCDTKKKTATYYMEIDGTSCNTTKERWTKDSNDYANVFSYLICDNLTVGTTYNITLYAQADAGTDINQYDESISVFEVQNFSINEINVAPLSGMITKPNNYDTVYGLTNISWSAWSNGDFDHYNVTLWDGLNYYATLNGNTTDLSIIYDFSTVDEKTYRLVVEGYDTGGLSSTDSITITVNGYDAIPENKQGIHIWIFVIILSMIGVSSYLYYKFGAIPFGIFAGVLLIVTAALIFNGITFNVCLADTASHYCGVESLNVPAWFNMVVQMLFLILGFGIILDAMISPGEKSKDISLNDDVDTVRREIRRE